MEQTVHCQLVKPNEEARIFFNNDTSRSHHFKTKMDGYLTIFSFFDHKYIDEDEAIYLIEKVIELELPDGEMAEEITNYQNRFKSFDEPFSEN